MTTKATRGRPCRFNREQMAYCKHTIKHRR